MAEVAAKFVGQLGHFGHLDRQVDDFKDPGREALRHETMRLRQDRT